ncbi:uncharacterized protein CcaverHIS019_0105670 [Cutaneotrichosporon cavernicola]|uniref:Palmitoyl-protein thioesterase 1 n=1 Tax=Cutaneotrichosporon cavernicola TaxID=279322 RepID=A0AA48HYH3_9TREE|nr:uncharacterized protein CcaverHIS019_0105670 [Cutaneotrichosporon cavernicola]BEI87849.1 hypothetical protein CcaverHIS019_0105670 [Cutaneotrichosporon cavernicola]BEI95623.1 hypothetical protein CcaverHIS631_0105720 [Cutaneotrichosporon cavernicola]
MLVFAPLLLTAVVAVPTQTVLESSGPRPLVIWHGLGDTAHSKGMNQFADFVRDEYPGIFVHSVVSPNGGSPSDEQKAGWWGVGEELSQGGCDQIKSIPELQDGFDAIGFSQGGLFLRWYAQNCDGPPVKNLITFGTPHFGITDLIPCPDPPTLTCTLASRAAKAGIYTRWAQSHLIQAQYYRDPVRMRQFLQTNTFLRDLNGEKDMDEEGGFRRENGGRGLGGLENVVAIAFRDDITVVPRVSTHWATIDPDNSSHVIPLEEQEMYVGDFIGLKRLAQKGGLHRLFCPGQHMDLGGEGGCGDRMVRKWVGWPA